MRGTTAPEVGAVGAVALPPSVRMVVLMPLRCGRGRPKDRRSPERCAGLRGPRRFQGRCPEARPPYFGMSGRPFVRALLRMDFIDVHPCVFVVFHDIGFVVFLHKLRYLMVDGLQP